MKKLSSICLVAVILAVCAVAVAAQKRPVTVFLAGDSTMAEKRPEKRPETGWGECLQKAFAEKQVKIVNRAQNGRSTKSFIAEGRWQQIIDELAKGDYVFLEFGHNDEKIDKPEVYSTPAGFKKNLAQMVAAVRVKGGIPVLLTPVMRRRFNEKSEFYDTHGEYPDATRAVAKELQVVLIDMHRKSEALLVKLGAEDSKKLFLIFPAGEYPNYPAGSDDNTHFSALGAEKMAQLALAGIRENKLGLAKYLKKTKVRTSPKSNRQL